MARFFLKVNWRWVGIGMNTLDRDTFSGEIISHFLTALWSSFSSKVRVATRLESAVRERDFMILP